MTRMGSRLDRLEGSRLLPATTRSYDLSRLSDDQLERVESLTERMTAGGVDALTPDEMLEMAELMDIIEVKDEP